MCTEIVPKPDNRRVVEGESSLLDTPNSLSYVLSWL